jgi:branched-chain amino acid transport system substrate-binding protein
MASSKGEFFRRICAVIGVALFCQSCGGSASPPRIGYAYPSEPSGRHIGGVAQQVIDQWGPQRIVEIHPDWPRKGQSEPSREVALAEAMVATPGIAGVVGHLSSRSTLLVAPIYAEAGIPLVVPTATSRRLRALKPWTFPLAPDEEAEGEFIVAFVVDQLRARRVTVFYLLADEYGTGLRDGVVGALRRRGLEPADQEGVMPDSDFSRRVAASLDRATPEAVVIAGRNREAAGIARAVHQRLPGIPFVAGDGVLLFAEYTRELADSAQMFYAVAFWHPDLPNPASKAFVARCRNVLGSMPSSSSAMFYDGLMILAQAVREVGSDPAAVRRYLNELGASRPPYQGVTGPISFGVNRPANLLMTRAASGVSVIVERP